jgi:hypothetical protein
MICRLIYFALSFSPIKHILKIKCTHLFLILSFFVVRIHCYSYFSSSSSSSSLGPVSILPWMHRSLRLIVQL